MTDRPPWDEFDEDSAAGPDTERVEEWPPAAELRPRATEAADGVPPPGPDELDVPLPDVPPPLPPGPYPAATPVTAETGARFTTWLQTGWRLTRQDLGTTVAVGLVPVVPGLIVTVLAASAGFRAAWGQPTTTATALLEIIIGLLLMVVAVPVGAVMSASAFRARVRGEALALSAMTPAPGKALGAVGVLLPFWLCLLLGGAALRLNPVLGILASLLLAIPLSAWAWLSLYSLLDKSVGVSGSLLAGWELLARDPVNTCGLGAAGLVIWIGAAAPCLLGVPLALPALMLAWAKAYENLVSP